MAEPGRPAVSTIPVHRSFADALVNGLIAQTKGEGMALARAIILVPNNRAITAISDAFVRRAAHGLLLPRIVPVGDVGDEGISVLFDGASGDPVPPAVDPLQRRFVLARLIQQERAIQRSPVDAAEAMRLASDLARALDELHAAEISPTRLREVQVTAELSVHWQKSLDLFGVLIDRWPEVLADMGRIDGAVRRNILLQRAAMAWRAAPPDRLVVAAGITTSARAILRLLNTVARLPHGLVVLPGLDLASADEEWALIDDSNLENHPQHHLRMVLDGVGVARSDVKRWRWGDGRARQAVRARAVSNAFAPAPFTAKWKILKNGQVSMKAVRQASFANPAAEAQGIAIALREAIETPGRTAALITPDRALAERVTAHLKRWGIDADDSAGKPLSDTPPGTLLLAVVDAATAQFAPVPLLALLKHPLVRDEDRIAWLDGARVLDAALRGPRPAPGHAGLTAFLSGPAADIWQGIAPLLAPLADGFAQPHPTIAALVEAVRATVETLAGEAAWRGVAGRAAADLCAGLAAHGPHGPADFAVAALGPLLRQLMQDIAVRPAQGGHPRVAIWGLLEARLQQADLLILGGMNEGVWPASPAPDPWLAPKVRTALGLGGVERRIGLSAHDLATALGGRDVLMTRARRDARSPTIASRFVLRLEAMTGGLVEDARLVALADTIDRICRVAPAVRPAPAPPAALRPRRISVTDVDRLKADPFAFYAKTMLKLRPLDALDAEPGPAWRGTMVHAILDHWVRHDGFDPAGLHARVGALLAAPATHPVLRALWAPRLIEAIDWIAEEIGHDRAMGRHVVASERKGSVAIAEVVLDGRADRIDRTDGAIAIVDYKTGKPPSARAVAAGYAMQLGLLGLIAEHAGFADIAGHVTGFEYWSLAKQANGKFGKRWSPVGGKTQIATAAFVSEAAHQFSEAAATWLTGAAPFTAKLVPEYALYDDYDQLMRLDEWYGRER